MLTEATDLALHYTLVISANLHLMLLFCPQEPPSLSYPQLPDYLINDLVWIWQMSESLICITVAWFCHTKHFVCCIHCVGGALPGVLGHEGPRAFHILSYGSTLSCRTLGFVVEPMTRWRICACLWYRGQLAAQTSAVKSQIFNLIWSQTYNEKIGSWELVLEPELKSHRFTCCSCRTQNQ